MLTVLTQMLAFISVNRSERFVRAASALAHRRRFTEWLRQPGRVEGRPPVPQWMASQFDHPGRESADTERPSGELALPLDSSIPEFVTE